MSAEEAVRRGLEAATSEAYRAQHPEEFERIVRWRLADSTSLSVYYEQMRAGSRFDLSGEVGSITSPTLVIHGAEDRYVPMANAVALAEAIPGAKLRILEDAGHLVFIERFADVNREVVAFLKPRKRRPQRRQARRKPKTFLEHAAGIREKIASSLRRLIRNSVRSGSWISHGVSEISRFLWNFSRIPHVFSFRKALEARR